MIWVVLAVSVGLIFLAALFLPFGHEAQCKRCLATASTDTLFDLIVAMLRHERTHAKEHE